MHNKVEKNILSRLELVLQWCQNFLWSSPLYCERQDIGSQASNFAISFVLANATMVNELDQLNRPSEKEVESSSTSEMDNRASFECLVPEEKITLLATDGS